jgi:hypothetical protein
MLHNLLEEEKGKIKAKLEKFAELLKETGVSVDGSLFKFSLFARADPLFTRRAWVPIFNNE